MILTLHNNPFQPNLVQTLSFLQLETNRNDETIEIQFESISDFQILIWSFNSI